MTFLVVMLAFLRLVSACTTNCPGSGRALLQASMAQGLESTLTSLQSQALAGNGGSAAFLAELTARAEAGRKLTKLEVELLRTVNETLENTTVPALKDTHMKDQVMFTEELQAQSSCNTNFDEDAEDAAKNRRDVDGKAEGHRFCRGNQTQLTSARDKARKDAETFLGDLSPPVFPKHPDLATADDHFNTSLRWFKKQQDAFAPKKSAWLAAEAALKGKIPMCDMQQRSFEVGYCQWFGRVTAASLSLERCWKAASKFVNDTRKLAMEAAEQRKHEFVSIRKIQCFLSVLFLEKASEGHTRVSECKGLSPDTSMFDLVNTTAVNKSDVSTLGDMSSKPGDASWQALVYTGLNNVKNATPCASVSHLCEANEYVLTHRCETCAAGKVNKGGNDAVGNNTNCTAIVCTENQHVVSHVCTNCAAGMINSAGDDASGSDTSCKAMICRAGQHVKSHACHTCPAGTENLLGGHDASKGDTSCAAIKCLKNQHVKSNACHTCSPGTTNAAGDDASGKDTLCDIMKCKNNQKVIGNVCKGCPPGKTNAAGDKASGKDTTCDSVICGTNQHVDGHACAACPDGMERPRGDDASGKDTLCAPIKCKANQRVLSHACTSCPAGQTNAAGDDASKGDTTCDESVAYSRQIMQGVGQRSSVRRRHTGSAHLLSCPAGKKPVSCGLGNWRGGRQYEQGLTAVTTEGCWSSNSRLSKTVVCVADKFTMSLKSGYSGSASCGSGMVVSGCMASKGIAVARTGAYPGGQTACHCQYGAQCSAHCIPRQNAPGYEIKTCSGSYKKCACPAGKKVLGCGMRSRGGTESSPTFEVVADSESCACYNYWGMTCYAICVDP